MAEAEIDIREGRTRGARDFLIERQIDSLNGLLESAEKIELTGPLVKGQHRLTPEVFGRLCD